MRQRYKLRVEVVPGLTGGECFVLIPTRTGKACLAVAQGHVMPDQYIEVWPSREEDGWVFVNVQSLEKRTPQVWVPASALRIEDPASGGAPVDSASAPAVQAQPAPATERAHRRLAVPSLVVQSPGTIRDISLGGISLDRVPFCKTGERCRLRVTDIFQDETCELEAEVVWCRHGRIGLRWVGLTSGQEQWLRQRVGTESSLPAPRRAATKHRQAPAPRVSHAPAARLTVAFQPPAALVSSLY